MGPFTVVLIVLGCLFSAPQSCPGVLSCTSTCYVNSQQQLMDAICFGM